MDIDEDMEHEAEKAFPINMHRSRVFNIANEKQLHNKVVEWIRRFHPEVVIVPGLGELQKTDEARMEAWAKGYTKGQADLLILASNDNYSGMCLEFKSPLGNGSLSDAQKVFLTRMHDNSFKVLVSNDYDEIIHAIMAYLAEL
jgi:hypothetical protein